jgi:phospholipid/cholesterol/gamma-HCH transport system ATP-binding protein
VNAAAPSPDRTASAIAVHGLTVGWGTVTLARDVTFDISCGEIFAIMGGSGSGKSTLLRYLVGLETPREGTIDIAGHGPPRLDGGLPPFGVMFQNGALFGSMTVLENVALPLDEWAAMSRRDVDVIARSKLRLVGLERDGDKLPAEISGGMTKRAAIARALALDPTIVFLDEPAAGLDPVTTSSLDDLIVTLARTTGLTVVMVTHEIRSVMRIVDRCLLLDRASRQVIAVGDPRELARSDDPRVHQFMNPGAKAKERTWRPQPTT